MGNGKNYRCMHVSDEIAEGPRVTRIAVLHIGFEVMTGVPREGDASILETVTVAGVREAMERFFLPYLLKHGLCYPL